MEENKKITSKLAVVSVLIATVLTGISVAFGYFIWNSINNTNISFTVEGAMVYLDDGVDITGANLVPVKNYTSEGAVRKSIKIKLKDTPTDNVTVTMTLHVNNIDSGLNHESFKWTLVKPDGTTVGGNFKSAVSGTTDIALVSLSSNAGTLTTDLSKYDLYIWIDGNNENPDTMQNQSFDFTLNVVGTDSSLKYFGTNIVESLDDGSTGDSGSGVYKVEHEAIGADVSVTGAVIPASTDYRYYGANPDNYICLKMNSDNTCPDKYLYRIIGSIYDELEGTNKLKVIKSSILIAGDGAGGTVTGFAWNQTTATNDLSYSQNIWAPVTDVKTGYSNAKELSSTGRDESGSTLMEILNSEGDKGLWWGGKSGTMYYYDNTLKSMQTKTVDFSGDEYKMESDVLSMISITRYYLAGSNENVTPEIMYTYERTKSETRYIENRPYYWEGKVALMYPSDYGYVAGTTCATKTVFRWYNSCVDKNWSNNILYDVWLLSPLYPNTNLTLYVDSYGGYEYRYNYTSRNRSVRPVFSLKPEVIITDGDGTIDNPYQVTNR